jgi:hypothetical protein
MDTALFSSLLNVLILAFCSFKTDGEHPVEDMSTLIPLIEVAQSFFISAMSDNKSLYWFSTPKSLFSTF